MIKNNEKLKTKIQETITNMSNLGVLPADEAQLNIDVIYNSVLDEICSVVPMKSAHQIISFLKLVYDSEGKSIVRTDDMEKDIYRMLAMNNVGAVPVNDNGYPTDEVNCMFIPNEAGVFMAPYSKVIPGTVNFDNGSIIDDGVGNLKQGETTVGTVDYDTGKFEFTTGSAPANTNLNYKFDIYNLMTNRNFVKFIKQFVEVFATLYQLDLDSATVLYNMKDLDYKKNIENILPQVLAQQIDQYILEKFFDLAETNLKNMAVFNVGTPDFNDFTTASVTLKYYDLGTLVNLESAKYASKNGVVPNVILCNPIGYGLISSSVQYRPYIDEKENVGTGTPKLVGYFNNAKVFLTNNQNDYGHTCIVLTYKGPSDAQAAGVFAPFIPVSLRTVEGMEGGGMITTTNAYSMGGFAMVNPDLVMGIAITNK